MADALKTQIDQPSIYDLVVPQELKQFEELATEDQVIAWESKLIEFFSRHSNLFTPFPEYFKLRCYELRILKQLAPELFSLSNKYDSLLELGCGFGYKTLLLSLYCKKILAMDIPEKFEGYVVGDFPTSVDVAKVILHEKFGLSNVSLHKSWFNEMAIESGLISCVFSEYVLEHIPDLSAAVTEMYRVLQPGGIMIHVVPVTTDGILQFIQDNIEMTKEKLDLRIAEHGARSRPLISSNGTIIPLVHSEFAKDFSHQIQIYSLENYLFPMLDAGFKIKKVFSTREANKVIVAQK